MSSFRSPCFLFCSDAASCRPEEKEEEFTEEEFEKLKRKIDRIILYVSTVPSLRMELPPTVSLILGVSTAHSLYRQKPSC